MILSFRHKGLEAFFQTGSKKGIIPSHAGKLARILDKLDVALSPKDMGLPGYRLHELEGKEKGVWSVWVNGNWRVTFRFIGENAELVDYRDYH